MTSRDFFRILIRIFALYSIILTVFNWIPANVIYAAYDITSSESIIILLVAVAFTILSILIYFLLIKKTDSIVDLLKIDKGFDNSTINVGQLDYSKILMIGIIIIGGLLIVTNFADFIQHSFLALKNEISKDKTYNFEMTYGSANDFFGWTFSAINIIIGYLLLTNSYKVAKWLGKNEDSLK